jgi:plastocyanin
VENMKKIVSLALFSCIVATPAFAEAPKFEIIIKDHQFSPAALEIPSGQKVKLVIKNQDSTPEEFESTELGREKVVSGNSEAVIFVGPLDAGEYPFYGEFNPKTARGKLVVK